MLKSVEMCPTSSAPDSTHSRRKWWRRATCLILLKEDGSWASATVALLSIQRRVGPDSGKPISSFSPRACRPSVAATEPATSSDDAEHSIVSDCRLEP